MREGRRQVSADMSQGGREAPTYKPVGGDVAEVAAEPAGTRVQSAFNSAAYNSAAAV